MLREPTAVEGGDGMGYKPSAEPEPVVCDGEVKNADEAVDDVEDLRRAEPVEGEQTSREAEPNDV